MMKLRGTLYACDGDSRFINYYEHITQSSSGRNRAEPGAPPNR